MHGQPVGNAARQGEQASVQNIDLVRTGNSQANENQDGGSEVAYKTLVDGGTPEKAGNAAS